MTAHRASWPVTDRSISPPPQPGRDGRGRGRRGGSIGGGSFGERWGERGKYGRGKRRREERGRERGGKRRGGKRGKKGRRTWKRSRVTRGLHGSVKSGKGMSCFGKEEARSSAVEGRKARAEDTPSGRPVSDSPQAGSDASAERGSPSTRLLKQSPTIFVTTYPHANPPPPNHVSLPTVWHPPRPHS